MRGATATPPPRGRCKEGCPASVAILPAELPEVLSETSEVLLSPKCQRFSQRRANQDQTMGPELDTGCLLPAEANDLACVTASASGPEKDRPCLSDPHLETLRMKLRRGSTRHCKLSTTMLSHTKYFLGHSLSPPESPGWGALSCSSCLHQLGTSQVHH